MLKPFVAKMEFKGKPGTRVVLHAERDGDGKFEAGELPLVAGVLDENGIVVVSGVTDARQIEDDGKTQVVGRFGRESDEYLVAARFSISYGGETDDGMAAMLEAGEMRLLLDARPKSEIDAD